MIKKNNKKRYDRRCDARETKKKTRNREEKEGRKVKKERIQKIRLKQNVRLKTP